MKLDQSRGQSTKRGGLQQTRGPEPTEKRTGDEPKERLSLFTLVFDKIIIKGRRRPQVLEGLITHAWARTEWGARVAVRLKHRKYMLAFVSVRKEHYVDQK